VGTVGEELLCNRESLRSRERQANGKILRRIIHRPRGETQAIIGAFLAGLGGVTGVSGEIVGDIAELDALPFVTRAELKREGGTDLVGFKGEEGVAGGEARWGDHLFADGGEIAAGGLVTDGATKGTEIFLDELNAALVGLVIEGGVGAAARRVDLGVRVVGKAEAKFGVFK
jgi:hypothetical protein